MSFRLIPTTVFTALFSAALSVSAAVHLNPYGYISTVPTSPASYSSPVPPLCFVSNNLFYTGYNGLVFKGNALYPLSNGILTLETVDGSPSAALRIYSSDGHIIFETNVSSLINFSLSANRSHALFYDGSHLIVLNCGTGITRRYPGALVFSCDDQGIPVYFSLADSMLVFGENAFPLPSSPRKIVRFNDSFIIIAGNTVYLLHDNTCTSILECSGIFFDCFVEDTILYLVERIKNSDRHSYVLYASDTCTTFTALEYTTTPLKTAPALLSTPSHEGIRSPLFYTASHYPYRIGNSYAEIQNYGGAPYLHPGVDFLGSNSQDVFAVHSGVVKAVLTTSADLHWRVAVASSNTADMVEGYLYAHLIQSSIPVAVGDAVQAGDYLGKLVPWPVADFTHTHFARIRSAGAVWNGSWWTIDNPLADIISHLDSSPPVFEAAVSSNLFGFRDPDGSYLDPHGLFNAFDVIVKCHDLVNNSWRVDILDMSYSLHPAAWPEYTVYNEPARSYDMPLGMYAGVSTLPALSNIYSLDSTCFSIGNYTDREYYHIVTNSFKNLATGNYLLSVTARDASLNSATTTMPISIIGNNPAGVLAVEFLVIDFSNTFIGSSAIRGITLKNCGTAPLNGSVTGPSSPFSTVSNAFFSIPPSSSSLVLFAFSPLTQDRFSNTVSFVANGSIRVTLTGSGIPEPSGLILLSLLPLLRRRTFP